MAIDYNVFYAAKGAAYRAEKLVSWSHYSEPVEKREGRVGGNSRIWGDASREVQRKVIDGLISAAKKEGFNVRRIAMLLAMAYIESGFNPDASAGTTSASGLGQFIDDTGKAYGLNRTNRFELAANISAIIRYFKDNEKLARKNKKPDIWVYKYHHDGPKRDYGGEKLTTQKFAPLADKFEKALNVGHVLTIQDPGGAPIADAHIKITQNGKTAVLKTDEKGNLPAFLANPDFGPIKIAIQKADEEFKELGELAIASLNSMWTVVAPKQKFPLKTYLHEKQDNSAAPPTGIHKVEKGQTISGIARLHETTYQELAKLNGIDKPYLIFPGQKLKVPPKKGVKAGAKPATAAASKPAPVATKPVQAQSAPARPTATSSPAAGPKAATQATPPAKSAAPATHAPTVAKPVVIEKRSTETRHPEAKVVRPEPGDRIKRAIAYGLANKKPKSIGRCLRYVKRALCAAGYFHTYPGVMHAKDFNPELARAGFANLFDTQPGINLNTAPIGSVIVYKPVEKQSYSGGVISGHIEIKCEQGYISDFLGTRPVYRVDATTMVSKISGKYGVSFQVTGIWYKE